jgi:hypothetical protein
MCSRRGEGWGSDRVVSFETAPCCPKPKQLLQAGSGDDRLATAIVNQNNAGREGGRVNCLGGVADHKEGVKGS